MSNNREKTFFRAKSKSCLQCHQTQIFAEFDYKKDSGSENRKDEKDEDFNFRVKDYE